jgi:hypothetical protein
MGQNDFIVKKNNSCILLFSAGFLLFYLGMPVVILALLVCQ